MKPLSHPKTAPVVRPSERRPTVIGVTPPAPGAVKPSVKGEIGRYSVVRGKSIR